MDDQFEIDLQDLNIGERLGTGDMEVMRVPNGWIFYRTHKAGITGTFVPDLQAMAPRPKNRIQLQ